MRVGEWLESRPRHREYITELERLAVSDFRRSSFRRDNAVDCLAEELCQLDQPYLKRPILSFLGSAGLAVFFEGSLAVSIRADQARRPDLGWLVS